MPTIQRRQTNKEQIPSLKAKDSTPLYKKAPTPVGGVSIIDACLDPKLFRPWFKDLATWKRWFVFLKVQFGIPLIPGEERQIFHECTGRTDSPENPFNESWLVCGRRGGKSQILAIMAVYIACFKDWRPYLSPGEKGTIVIIANDRKQARVIFRYIQALLNEIPLLKSFIKRDTMEAFELTNQVVIQVQTASLRAVRGFTLVACLLDEIAFWRTDESNNPDYEILDALRPGMATIPGAMLFAASSPYSRRGAMWETYKRNYRQNGAKVLVWQAPTWVMNPAVPQDIIDEAFKKDEASAKAEYGAEFRSDIENFLTEEMIDAVTESGTQTRSRKLEHQYWGFVDPSGGSHDSFTLGIAHEEDGKVVLDLLEERKPPFSPAEVVKQFTDACKAYGVTRVTGDRYGGQWVGERFIECGIQYEPTEKRKSDIYLDLLPLINTKEVVLLDNPRLRQQLIDLERRQARGGMETVDHPPGCYDDVANAAAGAIGLANGLNRLEVW